MKTLLQTAAELEGFLIEQGWRYCFLGGLALQRWGQPHSTNAIDVTVLTGLGEEGRYVDVLLRRYQPRLPEARAFALQNKALLLFSREGIPIDVALGGNVFEREVVSRATRYEFLPGLSLLTCSAEDLIVLKAFADRPADWTDVETILVRQPGPLDWDYVVKRLGLLCQLKQAPEIMEHLQRLRDQHP